MKYDIMLETKPVRSVLDVRAGRRRSIDCAKPHPPRLKYQFCPDSTTFLDLGGIGVAMASHRFDLIWPQVQETTL